MKTYEEIFLQSLNSSEFELSDNEKNAFLKVYGDLVKFNGHTNVTAITDPSDAAVKHFLDSMAFFKAIKKDTGYKIADVGCGAGFPGIPILICDKSLKMTFIDSVDKKLDFVRQVITNLNLDADVLHCRAEEIGKDNRYREKFDIAVSRAVASMNMLLELTAPLVKKDGLVIAYKGDISQEEKTNGLKAAKELGCVLEDVISYTLVENEKRFLYIFRKTENTAQKYPRRFSVIKKSPISM